jgi:hypothetical protein
MTKKSKKKEEQPGDQPRASKRKQQSAPVASGVSVPEKAKKPKGVAAETAISSVLSPSAEVGKEPSASNVAEEEQKMTALPKCAALPKEAIGAGAVPAEQSVGVETVEGQGVAGEKLEEAEDNKDDTMMRMRSRAMRKANTALRKMALKEREQLSSQMTQWVTSTICRT